MEILPSIIGLLISVGIAMFIAKDAESRGMNGTVWGIFTFLVCIVALPLYLIVRKPH
jgi:hypothetical protein